MKIQKLGIQLYTVRDLIHDEDSYRDVLKKLKALGYDVVHQAGCYGISFERFGQIAKEEGIEICGTHEDTNLMLNNPAQAIANHNALGTKLMGTGGFWAKGIEDVETFIKNANTIGKNICDAGFKFTYHNHSQEFIKLENGRTTMDMLVEGLDPKTNSFCFDTYWAQNAGCDVPGWIRKLAGRIDILHLKEMGVNKDCASYITEIGNGNMNWAAILEAAAETGVKYYVVEQDTCPGDPLVSAQKSSEYLHKYFM